MNRTQASWLAAVARRQVSSKSVDVVLEDELFASLDFAPSKIPMRSFSPTPAFFQVVGVREVVSFVAPGLSLARLGCSAEAASGGYPLGVGCMRASIASLRG